MRSFDYDLLSFGIHATKDWGLNLFSVMNFYSEQCQLYVPLVKLHYEYLRQKSMCSTFV